MRGPTSSPWEPSGLSLGPYAERDRLPRRPRESAAATGSRPCWQGGGFGELAGAARRQPVARVGAQPDGPERVDPQVPPRGPSARGRPGESAWRRHLEVGRFPALCGAVAQEDEGLARLGPLGARPAGHPDRRSACRRPCLGGGDRRRWQRRQACPGRGRGGDGEHCRRPGLARQSPRQGARSDAAPAVHRRWREGAQQSDPQHLRCGRRHPALPGPQGP